MYETKPIPQSEIVRFMQAKTPHAKCSGCGQSSFALVNEENINGAGLEARMALTGYPFPGYDIFKARTTDVVVFMCNNCGTVWQLSRKPVCDWLSVQL
ncbi:putative Zn finger protein [Bradyrhizobium sp. USDA 326]|uniref:hypothetical protein n=1 Tax=Bradyrhizobium sp. USDA 326 TaxID=3377726 RepID=UPI003C77B999